MSDTALHLGATRADDRIAGLQMLRGIAALMVLAGHVMAEAAHYFALDIPLTALPWTRGVDIFFVISGFVVALSARRYAGRPGAFLTRRALRVAPLYWIFTTLMVAVVMLAPGAAKETGFDPGQIAASYLFLPFERADGRIAPVLSLGWSLNYEMWFYAIIAACLMLPRPFLGVAAVLVGLVAAGLALRPGSAAGIFATNPIVLEFLAGIALARAWEAGGRRGDGRLGPALVITGFVLLVTLDGTGLPRWIAAGLPAALIVAAGTLYWPAGTAPGQGLGDASYALYLSHRFVLRPLTLILVPLLPATPLAASLFVLLAMAAALAVAVAVHAGIEAPLTGWLSGRRRRLART